LVGLVNKSMPHIHEKIDFTVDAFIVYENKVLLVFHRKHDMWLQIGGHVELDEDPEQALLREVKEECGLEIEIIGQKPGLQVPVTKFLYAPAFLNIHDINEKHKHIGMVYVAKAKSDKFVLSEREHQGIRWFSKEDLDKPEFNLNEAVRFYAKEALKRCQI
jgi:8-oxo-dGTP diphosphatase